MYILAKIVDLFLKLKMHIEEERRIHMSFYFHFYVSERLETLISEYLWLNLALTHYLEIFILQISMYFSLLI